MLKNPHLGTDRGGEANQMPVLHVVVVVPAATAM